MQTLTGLRSLIHDGVDAVTDVVAEGEASASRMFRRIGRVAPGLQQHIGLIDTVGQLGQAASTTMVHAVNHLVASVGDEVENALGLGQGVAQPVPMSSALVGQAVWVEDAVVGVLNGLVGDHLAARRNPLDMGMRLRVGDDWLDVDTDGGLHLKDARSTLVVLVHGLSATEWSWCLGTAQRMGGAHVNFGTRLADDLNATSVFVRYNTGLPIECNAASLTQAIGRLTQLWPAPVERLVLVGHSMGGLIAREAVSRAARDAVDWVDVLSDVVCLGSPHRGAPLAKIGALADRVFGAVDLPATRVIASILGARSLGMRDLASGLDNTPVPRAPHVSGVRYAYAAGTLTEDSEDFWSAWLGDGLVDIPSGLADALITARFGSVSHQTLQTDPRVYDWMIEVLQTPRL